MFNTRINSLIFISIVAFLFFSCKKEDKLQSLREMLYGGWNTNWYSIVDFDTGLSNSGSEPNEFLGEDGCGVLFSVDGLYYVDYSDGVTPIVKSNERVGNWELINKDTIRFEKIPSFGNEDVIVAQIIEVEEDFLWIRYEIKELVFDYKLKPIE